MNWWVVLQIVGGALITVGIVVFVEYFRKPRLKLNIANPVDVGYTNRPANKARYLGLMVENSQLPCLIRWLSRNTAVHCHGVINFYHLDGQNVFGKSMEARWSGSPEPVPSIAILPSGQQIKIIDPARLSPEVHRNIHPGESEKIDVAARFNSDVECYGWCNGNYFSSPVWRNPDWRLNPDRYLIKIVITSSGESCSRLFRLINDVPVNTFRLENAQPDDYKKVF